MNIIINQHVNNGKGWGNGGHGHCIHCGLALVTDLGYCSWTGTNCIDREPQFVHEFPEEVRSYVHFNGLRFNNKTRIFTKPYNNHDYTIDEIVTKVTQLKILHA